MEPTPTPTDPLTELFDELRGDVYYNSDEDIASIHWEWPGWLSPGFLTILAAQSGIGKSTLCLHLATSYRLGRP